MNTAPSSTPGGAPQAPARPLWRQPRLWLLVVAVLAGATAVGGPLDREAQAATDRVLRQALVTYAAARSLDAAVSLAEGTEFAVEPGGVGVTISAGEVLEPLDDLVEQFSSLMLVSATSLGVQSLLLRASAWSVLTILLLVFLVARVGLALFPERVPPTVRTVISRGTTLLLIARFAVPLYGVGTALLFERYLQPGQEEAVQALEETSTDVRALEELDEEEVDPGLAARVSRWFSGAMERFDVTQRVEALRERVGLAVDQVVHLLVVFALQTIVLPLAFLWVMTRVLTVATGRRG
ncbi:MAG TPA: hypothetical protein VK858_16790 [Longimicrobiales bacterium]|nr:hypothetical protein [Longimicrobiales bacterium]